MALSHKHLATSDVMSARHPYAQPSFTGCNTGNSAIDPLEVAAGFGRISIPKLARVIEIGAQVTASPDTIEATEVDGVVAATEKALRTLFEQLARQEARTAAITENVPLALCTLLERPEVAVKEYAAKCLERLATLVQGRALFGRHGFALVRALAGLLRDEAEAVRLCAMGALRMLSESRDGCELLLDAEAIVGLSECLSARPAPAPALAGEALFSLGNLTKMEAAITQGMGAGLVEKLVALMAGGEEDGVQMQALVLKCLWNICNLSSGKLGVINAGGVELIAPCLQSHDEDIRRLAVGALLAILVEQAGKEAAIKLEAELVEPLAALLDDDSEETRVNVVAVIRSICDHPAGRAMFTRHKVSVSRQWMGLFPTVVPA